MCAHLAFASVASSLGHHINTFTSYITNMYTDIYICVHIDIQIYTRTPGERRYIYMRTYRYTNIHTHTWRSPVSPPVLATTNSGAESSVKRAMYCVYANIFVPPYVYTYIRICKYISINTYVYI